MVLLIIGDLRLKDASFLSQRKLRELTKVRITERDAARGRTFPIGKDGQRLRELLGHEPTEVAYIMMRERSWEDGDCIIHAQRDYFTACKQMWVLREDGTWELMWGDGE